MLAANICPSTNSPSRNVADVRQAEIASAIICEDNIIINKLI